MQVQATGLTRAAFALSALLSALLAHEARAQSCQTNSECGPGYACLTGTGFSCDWSSCWADAGAVDAAVVPSQDAGSAGGEGGVVPIPPSSGDKDAGFPFPVCNPVCTPHEYRYCGNAPCTTNTDCPANMACHTESWQECSGGSNGCKPGYDCGDAGAAVDASYECTEHQGASYCTLRANLPCRTDSDCGDGYDCIQSTTTSCWGGGSVDPDGGYTTVDGGCVTEPSDYFYCQLQRLPCETDSECPSGLTCRDQYYYECDDASAPSPVTDGGVVDAGRVTCTPVLTRLCQQWYPGMDDGGVGSDAGTGVIGGLGGGTGGTNPGSQDAGAPPSVGGGAVGGGGPGGTGSVGGGNPPPVSDAGATPDAGTSTPGDDGEEPARGGPLRRLLRAIFGAGGCSTSGAPVEGNLGWLALLTVGLVSRRRQR
jgi:uncharacterized protein (TIGR03382 family)